MDFSDLYQQNAQDVFRFALFLTANRALAEDLTAETFARALVAKDDIRVDTVKAYLLAIARNLYRDLKRRDGRLVPLDEAGEAVDHAIRPDAATEERQLGCSVPAVKVRVHRARARLRSVLEQERA
jgi:RNA polymerase sigma-70 factor, ECF subfamily